MKRTQIDQLTNLFYAERKPQFLIFAITLLFCLGFFSSCEKVIQVDLNSSHPRLVVEAMISDSLSYNYVKLSKSSDFYEPGVYNRVEASSVAVENSKGQRFEFSLNTEGFYTCPSLQCQAEEMYRLILEVEGKTIEAYSSTHSKVKIDSIAFDYLDGGPPSFENPAYLQCQFKDPKEEDNYYRFRLLEGDSLLKTGVFEDVAINGSEALIDIDFLDAPNEGTAVRLELYTIDKYVYRYFVSLEATQNNSDTPDNPESNLKGNDVLGFFSANMLDVYEK